ncbi:acyl carrier protein [Streptomyces spinosus]|uniref:acyl carrier protein n=1 Tax=Streptomyces spinosus TaxID=2872623 RepID=UPI001CED2AEE|nr:acyl carrier protein [Streptomyces spinosus]
MDNTLSTTAPTDPAAADAQPEVLAGVVSAFEEALGPLDGVAPDDDFFELGGTSLTAAQTVALLRRRFAVKVTIRELFNARTAAAVAEIVRRKTTAS